VQRRPTSLEHPLPHRPTPQGGGRRYSPNAAVLGSGGYGSVGQDGAMEIRRAGDDLASVYSVDSAGPGPAQGGGGGGGTWVTHSGGPSGTHTRTTSTSSSPYSAGHASSSSDAQLAYKRDSLSTASIIDGYGDVEPPPPHAHAHGPRPSSVASFLPYDDPYGGMQQSQHQQHAQQQQHQHQPYAGPGADYFGGAQQAAPGPSTGYYPPGGESAYFSGGAPQHGGGGGYPGGVPAHLGGSGVGAHGSAAAAYAQQQQQQYGQPQAMHGGGGGWGGGGPGGGGFDYQQAAAARNPYYAAATGQLGLDPVIGGAGAAYPGSLHRGVSSASSMSMGGASLAPPSVANSLARSQSSLHVPGGPMRRKPTSGSTATVNSMASGASASSSGPPITKASVDDYRQRIKADPDPEAQFNFAKYLIEAAKKINSSAAADEKSAKKYRDALLAESLKLIKRLATQGSGLGKPAYADAQFFLANCLGNGSLGLQIDHEKAYNLYVQASKQNHSAATYRTAVCNEVGAGTRRDHARAVLFYRKASALGDTAGMYKLGMILLHGLLGQQRNPKEGLAWLRRAASQADDENPHALHELGLLHEKPPPLLSAAAATLNAKAQAAAGAAPSSAQAANPTLVAYDPAQAREFFTQAAQLGYPASQFKLGACYEYGTLTCPIDPRRSIAWYTRAAERGDPDAELALSGWYLTGSEGVLKQSDSEAYLWARRAANKGLPKAEYAVGYYSEVGIGVKADLEEAKRWYMRAAGAPPLSLSSASPLPPHLEHAPDCDILLARSPGQQARHAAPHRAEEARRRQARRGRRQEAADAQGRRDRVRRHVGVADSSARRRRRRRLLSTLEPSPPPSPPRRPPHPPSLFYLSIESTLPHTRLIVRLMPISRSLSPARRRHAPLVATFSHGPLVVPLSLCLSSSPRLCYRVPLRGLYLFPQAQKQCACH